MEILLNKMGQVYMGQILQFLGFLCWLSGDCLLCLSVIIFEFDAGMSRPVAESINMNSIHNGLKKTQLE